MILKVMRRGSGDRAVQLTDGMLNGTEDLPLHVSIADKPSSSNHFRVVMRQESAWERVLVSEARVGDWVVYPNKGSIELYPPAVFRRLFSQDPRDYVEAPPETEENGPET